MPFQPAEAGWIVAEAGLIESQALCFMARHGDEEGGSHGMICRAALICIVATTFAGSALGRGLTAADVNGAEPWSAEDDSARAVIIKAQVLLDRAGFSTGVIDGRPDGNFTNALRAFQ